MIKSHKFIKFTKNNKKIYIGIQFNNWIKKFQRFLENFIDTSEFRQV